MKRWLGALLAAVLVLTMVSSSALAAGTALTVKTPETIPRAGEEFTVTVDISGNPGFCALNITVAFDKTVAQCISISEGEVLSGVLSAANPDAVDGARFSAASPTEVEDNGRLLELQFQMIQDGDPDIAVSRLKMNRVSGAVIDCAVEGVPTQSGSTAPTTPSGEGTTTPTTPSGGGTSTPTTPSGGTTTPTAQETPTETHASPFPDAVGHWGEEWIAKAAERGLFQGDEKGNFRPNDNISRGDFVLVLWRMAGSPEPESAAPFADVPANAYYAKAVAWAYEKGYVNGKGSGFAPKDSLTRQEAMKILFGCAGGVSGGEVMYYGIYEAGFADSGEIASWAKPAMYWAYYKTIITGTGANKLSPTAVATRAQLAKILVGYQDMQIKEGTT